MQFVWKQIFFNFILSTAIHNFLNIKLVFAVFLLTIINFCSYLQNKFFANKNTKLCTNYLCALFSYISGYFQFKNYMCVLSYSYLMLYIYFKCQFII